MTDDRTDFRALAATANEYREAYAAFVAVQAHRDAYAALAGSEDERPEARRMARAISAFNRETEPERILALLAERDALLAVAEAARHAGATWDADQSGPWRPWEVYVDDFDALRSALTRLDAMLP